MREPHEWWCERDKIKGKHKYYEFRLFFSTRLREAFDSFNPVKIANYGEEKISILLQNKNIIRSRRKIEAMISNAKIFLDIQKEWGSFSDYIWHFTDYQVIKNLDDNLKTTSSLSDEVSSDLRKRGMKYVGSIIIYSYLQAIGVIDDHELDCFKY